MAQVLIAGCGYVGCALAEELAREGNVVWGIRRDTSKLPHEIRLFQADLCVPGMLRKLPQPVDYAVFCAAPAKRDEKSYRAVFQDGVKNFLGALERQGLKPRRVLFTSSVEVYGQQSGEWVDEDSVAEPAHFSGTILLEAEKLFASGPFPAVCVRLGEIYGPGRAPLLEAALKSEAPVPPVPQRYQNRIHVADGAGILHHLLEMESPLGLYLGVDGEPAAEGTVSTWLARRLGVEHPTQAAAIENAPDAGGNHRCHNDRILRAGYRFRFPTFREGYGALIEELQLSEHEGAARMSRAS